MEKENIKFGQIFDWYVMKKLMQYVKRYRNRFILLVLLTISASILGPVKPYLIQHAVDNYIAMGDFFGLYSIIMALLGVLILESLTLYASTFLSGWLGQYIIRDLRLHLYQHILSLRLKYYDNTPIGRLVTRVISDLETLSDVFSQGIAALLGDLIKIIFILGIMFYTNWKLTLMSLSTFPLLILSTYVFKEKVKRSFNEVRNAVSNLNTFVQEHISGMNIVQIFNAENRELKKFKEINKEHRKANIKSVLYYSVYFPVAEVIQAAGIGLLVWFGAREVLDDEVTIGVLIAFIIYISMFFMPIRNIADRFNILQMGIVSASRVFSILNNKEQIPNKGHTIPKNIKGEVLFENVVFSYKKGFPVLKNISFDVPQGKMVALVGATGAGKSSIISLLNRFYDIDEGHIKIDGIDIKEYDLPSLRAEIGVVLQDVFLFYDTIYNNITLGNPNISHEKVVEAAKLIGAIKFIEKLPGGFNYNVKERGATLSVGQRQMISFVRAMVYDPRIIVLDEATSSVDTETEKLIQKAINQLMKNRTAIVIAHRLSTIQKADKIIVMDKGKIKEKGTHQELLKMDGYYSQLYQMQYREIV